MGCPDGGSNSTFELQTDTVNCHQYGGSPVYIDTDTPTRISIVIRKNYTASNLIFKPMLCTAEDYDVSSEFVPYAPTNRDLYEGKIDHDIPALTGSILDYAVSLPVGIYFARHGSDSGVDKPVTGRRYMYQIMKYTSATITLIAYDGQSSNSDTIYMKNYTSSTWGSWIKFAGTIVT